LLLADAVAQAVQVPVQQQVVEAAAVILLQVVRGIMAVLVALPVQQVRQAAVEVAAVPQFC
jgi:hypothetical protein